MATMVCEAASKQAPQHESLQLLVESVETKILLLVTQDLSPDSLIVKAIHHQLAMGGRRTRSLHALQISQLLQCNNNDSVALATACELLHQASLVHDDLQDEHLTRHGKPSVWKKFGKDCALCIGDLFLSAAYAALGDCENLSRHKALLAITHACVRQVISGQCDDIQGRIRQLALDEYEEIVRKKSGALLGLPLDLAITYQGAPKEYELLRFYFETYALAYQSLDDVEDYQEDWLKSSALKSPNLLAIMQAKHHDMPSATAAAHAYINNLFALMRSTCHKLTPAWRALLRTYSYNLYQRYQSKKMHEQPGKSALVIGGGFGGIAAALRLRAKGYSVELIDRLSALGGRAQVYMQEGFRHDAGPTVITAPFLFEELFSLFGKKMADYVELKPVEPWYRFVFADGRTFNYGGTIEETLAEIARFNPADQAGYLKLLEASRAIYLIGFEKLADQPFHRGLTMLKCLPHLIRLKSYRNVWQLVSQHIKDPSLRKAFSIQPLLVGGNPFATTSIYNLIHYLERQWGISFPMGGTGALVAALTRLLQEEGVNIRLNTTVDKILIAKQKVQGVQLSDGSTIASELVVSNADPAYCYSHLIAKQHQKYTTRIKTRTAKFSMGLFVLYFGTTRTYPDVAHHTIWLGEHYKSLLADIFDKKILRQDFSMYVHRPTATDVSFAPAGCDSFYVLVPVPNLQGNIDWSIEAKLLQNRIIAALSRTILPDLEKHLVADFYKTPADFQEDYLSMHGAGFSIAPLFRQSAWFRYHNRGEGIDGLYHVGAGTHPGAGLPGVLSSAKVLDNLIQPAQAYAEAGALG